MYKMIVLFAMVAACLAAPRPGLVYSAPVYPQVVSPVAAVPVAYSSQSSSVVHAAPYYSAPVFHSAPVQAVHTPLIQTVPVAYY